MTRRVVFSTDGINEDDGEWTAYRPNAIKLRDAVCRLLRNRAVNVDIINRSNYGAYLLGLLVLAFPFDMNERVQGGGFARIPLPIE